MNKRIKELAEQAGWMMGDEVEGFNIRLEKFTGLIIKDVLSEVYEKNTEWYKKGYEQAGADQEDIGLIDLSNSTSGIRESAILQCIVAASNAPEPDAWDVAEYIAKSFGYAIVEDDKGGIKLDVEAFRNGEVLEGYTKFFNEYKQVQQDLFERAYSRKSEEHVKLLPEKKATWVERQVPEHLEDAVHDLITTLLKSHGYNWEGEKQE